MEGFRLVYNDIRLITIPWNVYVSAAWFVTSDREQIVGVLWRRDTDPATKLRLITAVCGDDGKVDRQHQPLSPSDTDEEGYVQAADSVLRTFMNGEDVEFERLDVRDKTYALEAIMVAIAKAESGYSEADA